MAVAPAAGFNASYDTTQLLSAVITYTHYSLPFNSLPSVFSSQLHVFGHIHEAHSDQLLTNGTTTFANVAICSRQYKPTYDPIVIDLPKRTPSAGEMHLPEAKLAKEEKTAMVGSLDEKKEKAESQEAKG